ncbi:hypothetical protein SAG0136_00735 [Streptococcus agalactiae LMG 14747]|uniref:Uncharacterized protein n=1 Tax=Streptococcus agalactiae LMG 14747 TaxID=1154860 RepID=V6Z0S1_STRAG|nr:hypothetical protein SAG0136_00735 [Streptococcus agalactiae LMG 14747]
MTENDYLEQAEKDRLELEKHRLNYMADDTPIEPSDIPKLMEIAQKLQAEDTSLNIYELYKHPEARAKLFSQIAEACYMALNATTTQAPKLVFCDYLEQQYETILKKMIASTDKQALGESLDLLELPAEIESQFIRDMAVSGLLAKD